MGPDMTMNGLSQNSNSDAATLAVPKLCDNRSNWADYQPWIQKAMGMKGLWRHVERTAIAPVLYAITSGVAVLSDGKMPAMEEQLELKESKIIKFEKREYSAQYIILLTTLAWLRAKIKDMSTAEEMWKTMKDDTTLKSTLFLLDVEDQLNSMKLGVDHLGFGPGPPGPRSRTGPDRRSEGPGQWKLNWTQIFRFRSEQWVDWTLGVGPGPNLDWTYFHCKINAVLFIQTLHMLWLHCPKKTNLKNKM